MTVDLDTRMRSAGDSLVRASERLSPAGPPRSLRPVATVVAGVVAAVALAAGTVAVLAGATATARRTRPRPRPCPGWSQTSCPTGVRPAGVVELPTDDAGVTRQSISVYGDPGRAIPSPRATWPS